MYRKLTFNITRLDFETAYVHWRERHKAESICFTWVLIRLVHGYTISPKNKIIAFLNAAPNALDPTDCFIGSILRLIHADVGVDIADRRLALLQSIPPQQILSFEMDNVLCDLDDLKNSILPRNIPKFDYGTI